MKLYDAYSAMNTRVRVTPIPALEESTIWLPINVDAAYSIALRTACAKIYTLEHLHILAGSLPFCFQRAKLLRLHNLIFASFCTAHVEIDSVIIKMKMI